MGCQVEMILASVARGVPIYTLRLRYWRAIHAETLTHRSHNRCSASSRAIPVKKMLDMVRNDTAGPIHWGKNESGMQASEENNELVQIPEHLNGAFMVWAQSTGNNELTTLCQTGLVGGAMGFRAQREHAWKFSAWLAASMSEAFSSAGYHKQITNRLTEPFQYITVILTATEWDNYFKLRCHKDAMPEFRELAEKIREEIRICRPQELERGDWHLPFVMPEEHFYPLEVKLKLSSARCGSASYKTVEGFDMTLNDAERIFQRFMGGDVLHASPTEHQAQVGHPWNDKDFLSPLRLPWRQYRKFIEHNIPITVA